MAKKDTTAPKWMLKLQTVSGIILIVISIFLYYMVVPKGLDQRVVFILLGFGILNLFFGRLLFALPQKQKQRARMLKEEKDREQIKQQKSKPKRGKGKR